MLKTFTIEKPSQCFKGFDHIHYPFELFLSFFHYLFYHTRLFVASSVFAIQLILSCINYMKLGLASFWLWAIMEAHDKLRKIGLKTEGFKDKNFWLQIIEHRRWWYNSNHGLTRLVEICQIIRSPVTSWEIFSPAIEHIFF